MTMTNLNSWTYILLLLCSVQSLKSSYRAQSFTSPSRLFGWNDKVEVGRMDLFDRKEQRARGRPRLSADEKAYRAAKRVEDKEVAQWVMDEMMRSAVEDIVKGTPLAKETVWIEVPYEQMLDYFKTYGNLHIPYSYEVAGYPLGEKIREMRRLYQLPNHAVEPMYKDELRHLCFEWKHSRAQYYMRRHQLTLYSKLYGHLLVPKEFTIPSDSDSVWPKPYHGVLLGQVVANMRNRYSFHEYREELSEMGFVWNQVDVVIQALEEYKRRHGNLRVKRRFLIPLEEEIPENNGEDGDTEVPSWPAVMRGMKLGELVSRITLKNAFASHRDKFIELGIEYKVKENGD